MNLPNINRIELDNGRFYMSYQTKNKYPSVSTILNKMQDNTYLESWKKSLALATFSEVEKKLPMKEQEKIIRIRGEKESAKIRNACADRGTKIHNHIEENAINPNNKIKLEKKQLSTFTDEYICPMKIGDKLLIETPVLWEKEGIGFGGTFDYYAKIQKPFKIYNGGEIRIERALIDWKNPLNVKYAEGFSKTNGKYYPLTKYFLQTAAYVAAFNQMVGDRDLKVNKTMVVLNPKKSKNTVYFYYCDAYKTQFYWETFKELLHCFFSNEEFNWNKLNKEIEAKQMIPTRVTL